jgi:Protein of unknown function (DUF4013)
MNNWQETLLFPIKDSDARKQFLIACLVTLAGFIIPLLPMLVLMGYGVKIMRQVIEEHKSPTMPEWQGSDWAEMLMDGLRVFGVQIVLMLPLFVLMGCGFMFTIGGSLGFAALANDNSRGFAPLGGLLLFIGVGMILLFTLLSFPYGIIISAAIPHVVANKSFAAGFDFKGWFPIFRKGLGNFIISYIFVVAISFVLMFVIQFAIITIVLICIVPFLMIPYTAYVTLIANTIYSQAYVAGRDALQLEQHATA